MRNREPSLGGAALGALLALLVLSPLPAAGAGSRGELPAGATPEGRILMLEDQRVLDLDDGLPDLKYYLKSRREDLRARAALAAGRVADPDGTRLLVRALRDHAASVRRAAAFALGEAADPRARRPLEWALRDDDPEVRTLAAEALSKLGDREALPALRRLLDEEEDPEVDAWLLRTAWRLGPEGWTVRVLSLLAHRPDRRLGDAVAYFLMRRPDPALLDLHWEDPTRRAWAARGLGGLDLPRATLRLLDLAGDEEPAVAIEALRALARHPRAAGNPRLLEATRRPELHVRLTALATIRALATAPEGDNPAIAARLEEMVRNPYPEGSAALAALARVRPSVAIPLLQAAGTLSPDWRQRADAAEALSSVAGPKGAAVLDLVLEDPDPRVLWNAIAAQAERMGDPPDPAEAGRTAAVARRFLGHSDPVVRAVAAEALKRSGRGRFEEFADCFDASLGEAADDAALACMEAAVATGEGQPVRDLLDRALDSADPVLRRRAGEIWKEREGEFPRDRVYPVRRNDPHAPGTLEALRGYSALASGDLLPRSALVSYEGGVLRLELYPEDAPMTVHNFARLARAGYFNGLTFHRVVPDFVVQDGDPRGDGWGGPGYAIRDEINKQRYEAGAVGMALSGPDTGGSQWFVALSPQPHLDGGYTVFGKVVAGLEGLRSARQGARILEVRVAP